MKHLESYCQLPKIADGFAWTECSSIVQLGNCTCDASDVTCTLCLNSMTFLQAKPKKIPDELRMIPISRLEWDSQRITVLCEFIIQELKDGAKIPGAIREELNDLLYLYVEPIQEA